MTFYQTLAFVAELRHSPFLTRPILDEERPPEGDFGHVRTEIDDT
jgi:hypothetical protein